MSRGVDRLQPIAAPNLSVLWLMDRRPRNSTVDMMPPPPRWVVKYKPFQSFPGAPILCDITCLGVQFVWSSPSLCSNLPKFAHSCPSIGVRPKIRISCETLEEFIGSGYLGFDGRPSMYKSKTMLRPDGLAESV